MRVGIVDGEIIIIDPDDRYKALTQYMHWDKKNKCLRARATLDTLKGLAGIFTLPPSLKALYERLKAKQDMIEKFRVEENPKLVMEVPLKPGIELYAHQIRAVNMALAEFEAI